MHGKEKIDGGDSAAWVREQNIPFVPALIFLDADGGEIFRADGYLRSFHLGSLLEYVEVGAQKTEPEFQRFIQNAPTKCAPMASKLLFINRPCPAQNFRWCFADRFLLRAY